MASELAWLWWTLLVIAVIIVIGYVINKNKSDRKFQIKKLKKFKKLKFKDVRLKDLIFVKTNKGFGVGLVIEKSKSFWGKKEFLELGINYDDVLGKRFYKKDIEEIEFLDKLIER